MSRGTFEEYRERREKYLGKILEYEELFRRDPDAYYRKANLIRFTVYAVYAVIVGVVAALFGLLLLSGYIKGRPNILWLGTLGYVLFQLIRAPFARAEVSKGFVLERSEAPKLYEVLETLAKKMGGVAFDGVRIDDTLNASAHTKIKNVLTGKSERYLSLGLPMLELFSAQEVEGVIAHELGHFRGAHGEKALRLYHAQGTLERAAYSLSNSWIGGVLRSTAEFFEDRFDVLLLAVKREQEYEADSAEVEHVGVEVFKSTGIKLQVFGPWYYTIRYGRTVEIVRKGWPGFAGLVERSKEIDRIAAAQDLLKELATKTRPTDTHPVMADRFRKAGVRALPSSEEEAQNWLDATLDSPCESALESWFTTEGKTRVRTHLEEQVAKDWEQITGRVEKATEDDDVKAIAPEARVELHLEASGANALTYTRRLYATDRVYGRAEYKRRLQELVNSENPFHRFLAIQHLWTVDRDLYEQGIVSLATVDPYENYAAFLLFRLLERTDRLDEGKRVFEFMEIRKEKDRDFYGVFRRGPKAMDVREASMLKDFEEYMTAFLTEYRWVSALYVVEARPKGTGLPFQTVFLVDYLSKKEIFLHGRDDYSDLTNFVIQQTQCPTPVMDICKEGSHWRKFMSDPRVRTLIPYREPERDPKEPFWKKFKSAE
jgi:Zn-dependent protease with chaperone function